MSSKWIYFVLYILYYVFVILAQNCRAETQTYYFCCWWRIFFLFQWIYSNLSEDRDNRHLHFCMVLLIILYQVLVEIIIHVPADVLIQLVLTRSLWLGLVVYLPLRIESYLVPHSWFFLSPFLKYQRRNLAQTTSLFQREYISSFIAKIIKIYYIPIMVSVTMVLTIW